MTKPAKQPKSGNRYTYTNMRARQAQTIVRCIEKIDTIIAAGNVNFLARKKLKDAKTSLIESLDKGDRLEELPTKFR